MGCGAVNYERDLLKLIEEKSDGNHEPFCFLDELRNTSKDVRLLRFDDCCCFLRK